MISIDTNKLTVTATASNEDKITTYCDFHKSLAMTSQFLENPSEFDGFVGSFFCRLAKIKIGSRSYVGPINFIAKVNGTDDVEIIASPLHNSAVKFKLNCAIA